MFSTGVLSHFRVSSVSLDNHRPSQRHDHFPTELPGTPRQEESERLISTGRHELEQWGSCRAALCSVSSLLGVSAAMCLLQLICCVIQAFTHFTNISLDFPRMLVLPSVPQHRSALLVLCNITFFCGLKTCCNERSKPVKQKA